MARRFRRANRSAIGLVIALAVAGAIALRKSADPRAGGPLLPEGTYRVLRAVDGDTLLLADEVRVRLIGVNAPESVKPDYPVEPLGPEASAFTQDFVAGGMVRLTFDRERLDRYGRTLAYVWVGERMLNEELLKAGLALWEPQYSYSPAMKRRFQKAQSQAQTAHRGIWSGDRTELP